MSKLVIAVALALVAPTTFQNPELVSISETQVTAFPHGEQALRVTIVNHHDTAVTAWMISADVTMADGSKRYPAEAVDGYLAYEAHTNEGKAPIQPGALATHDLLLNDSRGATVTSTRVKLDWAIFADGSWIGDAQGVRDTFALREKDRRALGVILAALREAANGGSYDPLRVALGRLNAPDQEDFDNLLKQTMRRNLEMAINGKVKTPPKRFLEVWILKTDASLTAAGKHRQAGVRRD